MLRVLLIVGCALIVAGMIAPDANSKQPAWGKKSADKLKKELSPGLDAAHSERLDRGMKQVLDLWRDDDGDAAVFEDFVRANFAMDDETLDAMFTRCEDLIEQLDGHMNEIVLAFRRQMDLTLGPILPVDEVFGAYDPAAHVGDDFFGNKIAFVALLNFPLTTLDERLTDGKNWTRRQWAEARLAQRFSRRVPADVNTAIAKAAAEADNYIAGYNIWMHHLVNDKGERLFPPKMRLLSHWNLRDEIKSQYPNGADALPKQRMIQRVMEDIVLQTIPEVVIDNPWVDWNPYTNKVTAAKVNDSDGEAPVGMKVSNAPEPDTRYKVLLGCYLASRKADPYSPAAPSLIARRFDDDREIPEERVEAMFDAVLSSPQLRQVAGLIKERLGRDLEPFDIWYNGFRTKSTYSAEELDKVVQKRYPTPAAYEKDIPNLLEQLDFPKDRAEYIASNIVVEPARGSGHAWGAEMRSAKSHLRTRVGPDGMDYKGFNIAVHEMGHNVEQTLSLNDIDYTLLHGVPNTAFTEALAFVFQGEDLKLLGLAAEDPKAEAMNVLNDFWGMCEIGAVALVDMGVWHWMYDHPDATPAELKKATIDISKRTWNKYYAPVMGQKDVVLLGVYSHMIHSFLYLPDYPMGYMIAFQVKERMKEVGKIGPEFERVCKIGNVAPDIWMVEATGQPVGPDALLHATEWALGEMGAVGKR